MLPRDSVSEAIRNASSRGRPALVAFMTAGFPSRGRFIADLLKVGEVADLIEIGLPFSDPMADGMTIQRSSRIALANGVTLDWVIKELAALANRPRAPLLLMSYLNPLLAHGIDRLVVDARAAGISGFIVPDLPFEECAEFRAALNGAGIALVQMVTPITPPARLAMLARESEGFVYAVTMTGTTGRDVAVPDAVLDYLDLVRSSAVVPVCAGFGIRNRDQVTRLTGHSDGVIVGSALVEVLERGEDPAKFLRGLRGN